MQRLYGKDKAKSIVHNYNQGKKDKYNFLIHYQVLATYFLTRKADFTVNFQPGQFLNRDLFDNTGPKAADVSAGALAGMLWPEESTNFEICKSRNIPDTVENKKYFDEVSYRMHRDMTHYEAGLNLAITEFFRDEVNFGTCGIAAFEPVDPNASKNTKFMFQAWDVKRMVIDEGPSGFVNKIYYEREETIENAALEFGLENLSEQSQRVHAQDKLRSITKINILHAIEPRYDRNPDGLGNFDLPVASCYIELGQDHMIRESGYDMMPVFVCRLLKNIREKYGRSFAMNALPDVLELNALREMEIVGTEKMYDPPLGILDDGRLGAGTLDTSAGAINIFNMTGRVGNNPPVFPLQVVGPVKPLKDRIDELKQSVSDHFMIDRLLDMQNETEMTYGEVLERQKLRAFVLNPIFSRPINEVFSPLIHYCFKSLLDRGYLGVLPASKKHQEAMLFGDDVLVIPPDIAKAMLNGEDVYDIKYLTPAARMMKTQLASGILNSWKFANDVAAARPQVYDNYDEDISARLIAEYNGAPREMCRAKELIEQLRKVRDEQMAKQQQFQQVLEMAKATKGATQPPLAGVESQQLQSPIQL